MIPITHIIDGKYLGEPRNWQDIEIEVDWLNKKEFGSVNITELSFVLEANSYLQTRILDGLTGGVGIFEGVPYEIILGDLANPIYRFEGYLDFSEEVTILGREEITLALKKKKGDDWLNDVAEGFSFAYLYDIGVITNSDYVKVPYVINYIPDGVQLMVIALSAYMMTKELVENIQAIAESIADITDASTPVVGASVGLGAGVVTAWDLGNFILAALKLAARIAYAIALVIAIKELIEALFEQLLPAKRNHLGMTFQRLMQRGCEHIGLRLQSALLEGIRDWVHIPQKDRKGGEDGEFGYPSNSSDIYTFGDLIRVLKEWFNADYRIVNGVFIFERRNFFDRPSTYRLPDFFQDQERLLDGYSFNTNEMVSNYNILYQYDVQDQNTLDDQSGRVFQAITSATKVKNPEFVSIKNLVQISIPFSMSKEKTKLTAVENALKDLGQVVDSLTGIFGGGTNFASSIDERIGSLLLSSHFLTIGKVVVMSGSKLATNQRGILNTLNLWNSYHYINSFADYQGYHNQYYRYKNQRIPMTLKEFGLLLDNNRAVDSSGQQYEIEKFTYNPESNSAVMDYRIKKKYTTNLKVEIVQ
jgi:hypothetical protein